MVRKTSRVVEDLYFSKDELVFDVLSKYLSQRDASFLKRNMSGLFNGDKVVIGEYIIGNIAHKYAEDNYSPQVANLVGSSGSYFSPLHPLTIDLKTGRVTLPQFVLLSRNLERELKYQYTRLTREMDELCRDIAEEILVILDEDPIDKGEEIQYDYESMERNRYKGYDESFTRSNRKRSNRMNEAQSYSGGFTVQDIANVAIGSTKVEIYNRKSENYIAYQEYLKDVVRDNPEIASCAVLYLSARGNNRLILEVNCDYTEESKNWR